MKRLVETFFIRADAPAAQLNVAEYVYVPKHVGMAIITGLLKPFRMQATHMLMPLHMKIENVCKNFDAWEIQRLISTMEYAAATVGATLPPEN